jgi:acyl-CoA dehydrogenase
MAGYTPRLEEIDFVLNEVADLEAISKLNGYQHADPDTVRALLDEAARFFSEVIAPLYRVGDTQGSVLEDDGTVRTPDGFKDAYEKFVEAGWAGFHMPEEWGGGGMPYMVGVVIEEMFKTANMAFSLCPMLTHSAVEALVAHGSPELQSAYLENLVSGRWTGTMNLTEPQAGSDLGAVRVRAEPQGDGSYRIFGTKIFITWGDHDLTDNVIHLVLARTPDAAPGTKGISMFLVPKYVLDENGEPGQRNDLNVVSLEHKLGIHASPTCVVSFGDDGEGAVGYLVGEEQQGMRNMFTMMNPARVGVGMEGLAMSERAYQKALSYARERVQGRAVGSESRESVPIIEHPDVRRNLLTMRSYIEAMRALLYVTAETGDRARRGDDGESRAAASDRLAVLTPIIKAWSTDIGVEMASIGIQVHGGMGYIEETGAAQIFRDSRIAPIYEGTNGIQSIDLVLRKLPLEGGRVIAELVGEMREVVGEMGADPALARFRDNLGDAIDGLARTSTWLGERLASGDLDSALAGATPYMRQIGTVVGGWLMARSALAASAAADRYSPDFISAKLQTARFYGEQLLPAANAAIPAVEAGGDALEPAVFADL